MRNESNLDLDRLATNQKIKLKRYWTDRLKDFQLNTYFEGNRESELTGDLPLSGYGELKISFPERLAIKIEKMSSSVLGKQMIVLGSLSVLANKYSSAGDIGIFSPLSTLDEQKQINNQDFVLNRFSEFEELDFSNFLQKVKNNLLDDFKNKGYTLQNLFDEEDPEFNAAPKIGLVIANDDTVVQHDHINFDLLFLLRADRNWTLSVKYNKGEFDPGYIETLAERYFHLTEKLIDEPEVIISEVELASPEERHQVLFEFNQKPSTVPFDGSIISLFESQVKKNPEKLAVSCGESSFSYRELNDLVNQFARFLKKTAAIKADDLIAIELERNAWTLVAILSVLKTGAAYVPIETDFPKDRKAYILSNSKIKILINQELLDLFKEKQQDFSKRNFNSGIQPADLAYVIFTSGSTGEPKGAMVTHEGMINHLLVMGKELHLDAGSKILQNALFTFDISVWQFLNALIVGGETIIYTKDIILNVELFLKQLHADQVSILQIVPSYFGIMLDFLKENRHQYQFDSLNYLLVTGEEISHALLKKWFKLYPGKVVVNAYGPAEAADDVTLYFMDSLPLSYNIPVGKPIMNTRIYLLNKDWNLCPVGIIGEIYVSGICVGRGYLNDQPKTEAAFFIDPFFKEEHQRMYKTGDFGRWLPDGSLEFLGRKDDQIKISGYRIELREIEFQLMLHPGVAHSLVLVKRTASEDYLVAYYTSADGTVPDDLNTFLGTRLPKYMIPAHFIYLSDFPVNSNGKIDKKILPLPGELSAGNNFSAPETMTEEILAEIWSEILNTDKSKISTSKSFFELGGQSLKVMVLVNKISKQFNVNITIPVFFSNPTIRAISLLIEECLLVTEENDKAVQNKTNLII